MQEPPDRAPQRFGIRTSYSLGETRILAKVGPALATAIDVAELETTFLQVPS